MDQKSDAAGLVRTSHPGWAQQVVAHFKAGDIFELEDDANLGVQAEDLESSRTLFAFLREQPGMNVRKAATAITGAGLAGAGVWMVAAAIADPEPTSKLGLLVGGGITLALTGGLGTLSALGIKFSVEATGPGGSRFRIGPNR